MFYWKYLKNEKDKKMGWKLFYQQSRSRIQTLSFKKIYRKPYNPTFLIYSLNGLSSQESVSLEEEFSGTSLCRTHEEIREFKEGVTKFICMLIQLHRLQLDHFSLAFAWKSLNVSQTVAVDKKIDHFFFIIHSLTGIGYPAKQRMHNEAEIRRKSTAGRDGNTILPYY